jgi:uncharacterized membrane protein YbaN (DUF454 family)
MHRPESATDLPLRSPLVVRWLLWLLAVVSLGLGILGLFLPVLPTVPFVLLSAWAAARSSPRLNRWLLSHPVLGPHIQRWRRGGVVPRRAKWLATGMMAASGLLMLGLVGPRWHVGAACLTMAVVAAWLWRRPEAEPD